MNAEFSVYWPLWLVCICGLVLIAIAVLSLLLIKGYPDHRAPGKQFFKFTEKFQTKQQQQQQPEGSGPQYAELQFFRIGRDAAAQVASISSGRRFSVGSGKDADICLDPDDKKLAQQHFLLCINGVGLSVSSPERETFVNGVPIRKLKSIPFESGDLIRAGSYEYRVIYALYEERENAT